MDLLDTFSDRVYINYKKRLAQVISDLTTSTHGKRRHRDVDQNKENIKKPHLSCDKIEDKKEEETSIEQQEATFTNVNNSM